MTKADRAHTTPRPLFAASANDNINPLDCRWRRLIDKFRAADLPTLAVHAAEQKLKGRDFDNYVDGLLAAAAGRQ